VADWSFVPQAARMMNAKIESWRIDKLPVFLQV
jgi:hypothetical protein